MNDDSKLEAAKTWWNYLAYNVKVNLCKEYAVTYMALWPNVKVEDSALLFMYKEEA